MANNGTNIPIDLQISGLLSSFKSAGAAAAGFATGFQNDLGKVAASIEKPTGALSQLQRELAITKRMAGDRLAIGATVPPELITRLASLTSSVGSVQAAFNTPLSPFGDLNNRLADTKARMQDILATGGQVPAELSAEFNRLSGQVDRVNKSFQLAPPPLGPFAALNSRLSETQTKIQDIVAAGGKVPTALTSQFQQLTSQVSAANRALLPVPTSLERISSFGGKLQAFGRVASVVTAGIALVGVTSFKSYAEINALQLGLENITGSAAGAKARFAELMPVIKLPGLGLEEAVKGDVRLQAVGFSALQAKQALLQFGNAIALTGGGKFELDSVLTQLTQMSSKSRVLSEDLKPILNSSPAISKAVRDMFGTVSSEEISGKLQAAGKGPKEFITELVQNLSQLERVKGGPKNALENLSDSVKLAQFQFGQAADNALGLTSKIDGLGNLVGSLASGFGELSPGLQVTILGLTGVAGAIGPLALGIGTAAKLLPTLTTGLAGIKTAALALVSPIGLTVAAVAALGYSAYSIYQFNQSVKSTVDAEKQLKDVTQETTAAIAGETARLNALVTVARDETKTKKQRETAIRQINEISPKYLGNLTTETINTQQATGAISQYIKVLDLKARAQIFQNRLADSEIKLLDTQNRKLSTFVDTGDALAATLQNPLDFVTSGDGGTQALRKKAKERQTQMVADFKEEARINRAGLETVIAELAKAGEKTSVTSTGTNYLDQVLGSETLLKQKKDRLKALKAEIFEKRQAGQDVSALTAEYQQINAEIKDTNSLLTTQKEKFYEVAGAAEVNGRILSRLKQQLEDLPLDPGVDAGVSEALRKKQEGISAKIKGEQQAVALSIAYLSDDLKKRQAVIDEFNKPVDIGGVKQIAYKITPTFVAEDMRAKFAEATRVASAFAKIPGIDSKDYTEQQAAIDLSKILPVPKLPRLAEFMEGAQKAQDDLKKTTEAFKATLGITKADLVGAGASLFEGLSSSLANKENPFKNIGRQLVGFIGDFAIKLGSAILLMGKLETVASAIPFLAPLFALTGPAKIAAGIGFLAGGAAIKAIPFANGGIVHGPTLAMTGEYSGARNNPEVIAPLSKLKDMLPVGRNNTQVFIPEVRLGYDAIYIGFKKGEEAYNELS